MKKGFTTALVWTLLVAAFVIFLGVSQHKSPPHFVRWDVFLTDIDNENISAVEVDQNQVIVSTWGKPKAYRTLGVLDNVLLQKLSEQGVTVGVPQEDAADSLTATLLGWIPFLIAFVAILYFLKRMNNGGVNLMSLRKTRARVAPETTKITFAQVGGCEEAKEVFADVVDYIKNPKRWINSGARLPRGILLEGPSGCGKTLLARAVAGETNATFYFVSASEFTELFVGVGAARVRDTFETAARTLPAVIFIDEIDAVGRRRGAGVGFANDEREQTLNQLLVCMDGFQPTTQIVVIAATNRADILDPALVRPGRFDKKISLPALNENARLEVLKIHSKGKSLAAGVSLESLARETAGMTGAQLENVLNEAALLAVRRMRQEEGKEAPITKEDLHRALHPESDKVTNFSSLDQLLIDSATHLAKPNAHPHIRITLRNGDSLEGAVLWADNMNLKLRKFDGQTMVIQKYQVLHYQMQNEDVEKNTDLSDLNTSCDSLAAKA